MGYVFFVERMSWLFRIPAPCRRLTLAFQIACCSLEKCCACVHVLTSMRSLHDSIIDNELNCTSTNTQCEALMSFHYLLKSGMFK